MASVQSFDDEMERIGAILRVMRDAWHVPAAILDKSARSAELPERELVDAEDKRFEAELIERQAVEAALARIVQELAADIAFRKREFDNRELPIRGEKLLGLVSKAAMLRRQQSRWRNPVTLHDMERLFAHADRLAGLIREERARTVAQRKKSEADLAAFVDHRPEIIKKLRDEDGQAMTKVEALGHTERSVAVFQRFVGSLNSRVETCNILLHKLTIDVEDLLILYQVTVEAGQHEMTLRPESFTNLPSEMARFSLGRLTIQGLERRRHRADLDFVERFPGETITQDDAAGRPLVRNRWRFPTLADLKQARS